MQDPNFTNDVQDLIKSKQKNSAFVYVRNHMQLIEQALNEGAKIIDIHSLLIKNGIEITLPTLRLYLHRLRNKHKKHVQKNKINTLEATTINNNNTILNSNQLDIIDDNKLDTTQAQNTFINPLNHNKNLNSIKNQNPNLEELSKAFKFKN